MFSILSPAKLYERFFEPLTPKKIIAKIIAKYLGNYLAVDSKDIEASLHDDSKFALNNISFKPFETSFIKHEEDQKVLALLISLTGSVRRFEFSWKWGGDHSLSFISDVTIIIDGLDLKCSVEESIQTPTEEVETVIEISESTDMIVKDEPSYVKSAVTSFLKDNILNYIEQVIDNLSLKLTDIKFMINYPKESIWTRNGTEESSLIAQSPLNRRALVINLDSFVLATLENCHLVSSHIEPDPTLQMLESEEKPEIKFRKRGPLHQRVDLMQLGVHFLDYSQPNEDGFKTLDQNCRMFPFIEPFSFTTIVHRFSGKRFFDDPRKGLEIVGFCPSELNGPWKKLWGENPSTCELSIFLQMDRLEAIIDLKEAFVYHDDHQEDNHVVQERIYKNNNIESPRVSRKISSYARRMSMEAIHNSLSNMTVGDDLVGTEKLHCSEFEDIPVDKILDMNGDDKLSQSKMNLVDSTLRFAIENFSLVLPQGLMLTTEDINFRLVSSLNGSSITLGKSKILKDSDLVSCISKISLNVQSLVFAIEFDLIETLLLPNILYMKEPIDCIKISFDFKEVVIRADSIIKIVFIANDDEPNEEDHNNDEEDIFLNNNDIVEEETIRKVLNNEFVEISPTSTESFVEDTFQKEEASQSSPLPFSIKLTIPGIWLEKDSNTGLWLATSKLNIVLSPSLDILYSHMTHLDLEVEDVHLKNMVNIPFIKVFTLIDFKDVHTLRNLNVIVKTVVVTAGHSISEWRSSLQLPKVNNLKLPSSLIPISISKQAKEQEGKDWVLQHAFVEKVDIKFEYPGHVLPLGNNSIKLGKFRGKEHSSFGDIASHYITTVMQLAPIILTKFGISFVEFVSGSVAKIGIAATAAPLKFAKISREVGTAASVTTKEAMKMKKTKKLGGLLVGKVRRKKLIK